MLDSSAISRAENQESRRLLYVTYTGGSVPRREHDDLLQAKSKGAFVNERIKPLYKYQRLSDEA